MSQDNDYKSWLTEDLLQLRKEYLNARDKCEEYSERVEYNKLIREVNEENSLFNSEADILAVGLDTPNSKHRLELINFDDLRKEVNLDKSDAWLKTQTNILRYGVLNMLWGFSDDDIKDGAVTYTHLADEVLSEVSENNFTGFILNPVALDEVFKIADLGERLPQKSTYFHPKLGSGLLFYPLIKDERG